MRRLSVSLSIVALLAIGAAGCVNGQPTNVFVAGNAALDNQCMVQQDKYLLEGEYDTFSGNDYVLHLAVDNQTLFRPTNAGVDPNGVHFDRAEVSLEDVTGANIAGIAPYSVPATGYVPSATDTSTPGVGYVDFPAIPASVGAMIQGAGGGRIHVGVTLYGKTNGGLSMQTDKWYYDVYICATNCLYCVNVSTCFPGQDGNGWGTNCP